MAAEVVAYSHLNLPQESCTSLEKHVGHLREDAILLTGKGFVCGARKDLNPMSCDVKHMTSYLLYLAKSGLSHPYLRVLFSAVSAYRKGPQHESLFKVPLLFNF